MAITAVNGTASYTILTNSNAQRIGGVSMPDYNDVMNYTKSDPKMSDDKFHAAIAQQAKKDFESGKFQNDSSGFNALIKDYVQVVSPDRKSIIADGLTMMVKKPAPKAISLLEIMFGKGSAKYHKTDNEITYAEFYDSEGNMVANYDRGKWTQIHTPTEVTRQIEFCSIYNQAWGDAKRGVANGSSGRDVSVSTGEASFDQLA